MLVRLTRLLALRGAVPVPIRLREAQEELDFLELERARFLGEVESRLLSDAEGDKIWRKLLDEDRIVVLADGLEEALSSGKAERSRDATIRLAFIARMQERHSSNRAPSGRAQFSHSPRLTPALRDARSHAEAALPWRVLNCADMGELDPFAAVLG
jgi:hypothetical protein